MKLYQAIATALQARRNIENGNSLNEEWYRIWGERLDDIACNALPSGSGIDSGTQIDHEARPAVICLNVAFHHMDEHGRYAGWTEHEIIVSPTFDGIDVRVTGRNRNDIKTYLGDLYHEVLTQEYVWPIAG